MYTKGPKAKVLILTREEHQLVLVPIWNVGHEKQLFAVCHLESSETIWVNFLKYQIFLVCIKDLHAKLYQML